MPNDNTPKKKHQGFSKHEAYKNYTHMLYRCHNEKSARYKEWGGRGIKVCERWRENFLAFVDDMGPKPTPKHSIDRIDNNLGYSPENCRWADAKMQTLNSSHAVFLKYNGKRLCLKDWARELGVPYKRITKRYQLGWPVEKILETPHTQQHVQNRIDVLFEYQGIKLNYIELAKLSDHKICHTVLYKRLFLHNWTLERALKTPLRTRK